MTSLALGDRVVCVHADGTNTVGIQELVEGQIYVVSWVGSCACGDRIHVESVTQRPTYSIGDQCIWVAVSALIDRMGACGAFEIYRFRKIEHPGMEILHEIRLGQREPEREKELAG